MDHERILFSFSVFLLLGLVFSSGSKSNGTIGNGSTTLPPSESSIQPTVTTLKPTGKHSSSSKNATTSAPEAGCSSYKNCEDCIDKYKCFWCGPSKSCEKWPKNRITPKSCSGNKWYWKQCTVPGLSHLIVIVRFSCINNTHYMQSISLMNEHRTENVLLPYPISRLWF